MQWPPLPDHGCIIRWPSSNDGFIHPEDREVALSCFPSERVFRRDSFDGEYYHYSYGDVTFRLRPVMWLKVKSEGIDVGDLVETVGVGLERERFVAQVWGVYYVSRKGRILYRLKRVDQDVPRLYTADQLKLLTDKSKIEVRDGAHPQPRWTGEAGERLKISTETETENS